MRLRTRRARKWECLSLRRHGDKRRPYNLFKTLPEMKPSSLGLLAAVFFLAAAHAQEAARDSLTVQKARTATVTSRGKKQFYTRRWDLSDLPDYRPEQKVSGTIRFWGSNYFTDGNLAEYWIAAFAQYQPEIKLEFNLKSAAAAIPGLLTGVADIAINRKITWKELLGYQRTFERDPLEIVGVTGSYDVPGWSNAL